MLCELDERNRRLKSSRRREPAGGHKGIRVKMRVSLERSEYRPRKNAQSPNDMVDEQKVPQTKIKSSNP